MNPRRADIFLAERPEAFRAALIHPVRDAKREPLHRRKHAKLVRRRVNRRRPGGRRDYLSLLRSDFSDV